MGLLQQARRMRRGAGGRKRGLLARAASVKSGTPEQGSLSSRGLRSRAAGYRETTGHEQKAEGIRHRGLLSRAAAFAEQKKKIAAPPEPEEAETGAEVAEAGTPGLMETAEFKAGECEALEESASGSQEESGEDADDIQARLDRKILDLTNVFEISKEVTATLDIDALLSILIFTTMGQMGVQRVFLCSEDSKGNFPLRAQKGLDQETASMEVSFAAESDVVSLFSKHAQPMLLEECRAELGQDALAMLETLQTEMLVPLTTQDKLSGIIGLGGRYTGLAYLPEERDFMATLASMAAIALENARLYTNLKNKLNQFSALYDISKIINTSREKGEVIRLAVETLETGFHLKKAAIFREESGRFPILQASGLSEASLEQYDPTAGAELFAAVLDAGEALDISDFHSRPELASLFSEQDMADFQSFLLVPLLASGEQVGLLGIFAISGREKEPFTREEKELFSIISSQLAPPFLVASLLEKEDESYQDPFAAYLEQVRTIYERSSGFSLSMGIIVLAIQDFKSLENGIPAERFAAIMEETGVELQGILPETARLIRSAPNAFTILLPGASIDDLQNTEKQAGEQSNAVLQKHNLNGPRAVVRGSGLIPEDYQSPEEFLLYVSDAG